MTKHAPASAVGIRDLAHCAEAIALGRSVAVQTINSAAPVMFQLLQYGVLASLINGEPDSATVRRIALQFSQLASANDARDIVPLVDWWHMVFLGEALDGSFHLGARVPKQLHAALRRALPHRRALLHRALQSWYIHSVVALRQLADQPTPTDRVIFERLMIQNADAAIAALQDGRVELLDDILGRSPEDLVTRADPGRTIPRNGVRWPGLVERARELQEAVACARETAVAMGSLESDTDFDPARIGGASFGLYESLVTGVERNMWDSVWIPAHELSQNAAQCLAALLHMLGVRSDEVVAEWDAIDRETAPYRGELNSLLGEASSGVDTAAAREAADALRWGLVDDAQVWIAELRATLALERMRLRSAALSGLVGRLHDDEERRRVRALLESANVLLASGNATPVSDLLALAENIVERQGDVAWPSRTGNAETSDEVWPDSADHPPDGLQARARTALAAGHFDELIALAPSMVGAEDQWFWRLLANEVPIASRAKVWVGVRRPYLEVTERNDDLTGLLLPPQPPRVISLSGSPADRSLLVHQPKREFTLTSREIPVVDGAIIALEHSDPATAADLFRQSFQEGWFPGLGHAVACYLEAGRPDRALSSYADFLVAYPTGFIAPGVAWNLAVAYEWVGEVARSAASLRYFLRVLPGDLIDDQATQIGLFEKRHPGAVGQIPAVAALAPVEQPRSGTARTNRTPQSENQLQEIRAREEYERGDTRAAIVRLRRHLEKVPRSPAAHQLLKYYRELGQWEPAEKLIADLDRRGTASWRHFVELARVQLVCNRFAEGIAVLDQIVTANEGIAFDATYSALREQLERSLDEEHRSKERLNPTAPSGTSDHDGQTPLSRDDLRRVLLRYVTDGELARAVALADSSTSVGSWAAIALLEAVRDLSPSLADDDNRARLIEVLARASVPVVIQTVEVLRVAADREAESAPRIRADVIRLLELARGYDETPLRSIRLGWTLARALEAADREPEAQQILTAIMPPPPNRDVLPTVDSLPRIDPLFLSINITNAMPESVVRALGAARSAVGDPARVADSWVTAFDEGAVIAGPSAIGWLVAAGRCAEALDFYLRNEKRIVPNATLLWNIAAALANCGQYTEAVRWFRTASDLSQNDPPGSLREARDALFAYLGESPPSPRTPFEELPDPAAPITPGLFRRVVKILRNRLSSGRIALADAYAVGLKYYGGLADPASARGPWAVLLHETEHSDEAYMLLAEVLSEADASNLPFVGSFVKVAERTGRAIEGIAVITRLPKNSAVLVARAKLELAAGDRAAAKKSLEAALALSPRHDEASKLYARLGKPMVESLEALGPLFEAPAVRAVTRTANGDIEVVLGLRIRRALSQVICAIGDATPIAEWHDLLPWTVSDAKWQWHLLPIAVKGIAPAEISVTLVEDFGDTHVHRVTLPAPQAPQTVFLPFDPNEVVEDLFVGRSETIRTIEEHYRARKQILFLGGPRQVGKSSLVVRCRRRSRNGESALTFVYMDGERYARGESFLTQVAAAISLELEQRGADGFGDPPPVVTAFQFQKWFRDRVVPYLQPDGMVLVVDEIQVMFERLSAEDPSQSLLRETAGVLRSLNADVDIPLKILLLGSCTFASVRDRLLDTNIADELREETIGFLTPEETRELVVKGFNQGRKSEPYFFVLPDAFDELWAMTAGYPNHVHLLARRTADHVASRGARVISAETVRDAAETLVRSGRTVVQHLLGREREREYQQRVLSALAEVYGSDSPEDAVDPPTLDLLKKSLGPENAEGIERFLRLGLLRETDQGAIVIANGLASRWLTENAIQLRFGIAGLRERPQFSALRDAGFALQGQPATDAFGLYIVVEREGSLYRARRVARPDGVNPDDLIQVKSESLLDDSAGWVEDVVDPWLLISHAQGRPLSDFVLRGQAENWELRDTIEVVKRIRDAASVLQRLLTESHWVHGNLSEDNVIHRGSLGTFLADSAFGSDWMVGPLTRFTPGPLRPPQQQIRFNSGKQFSPKDDVFALGALLVHVLDRQGRHPYSMDPSGHADVYTTFIAPEQAGVDAGLVRIARAMCDPDEESRPDLDYCLSTLTRWVAPYR